MRRIRRGLKRLWRMSDPYYAAKDDGLVMYASNRPPVTPKRASQLANYWMRRADKQDWHEDPSYDWVAETRRAKTEKANGKTA